MEWVQNVSTAGRAANFLGWGQNFFGNVAKKKLGMGDNIASVSHVAFLDGKKTMIFVRLGTKGCNLWTKIFNKLKMMKRLGTTKLQKKMTVPLDETPHHFVSNTH